MEQSDNILCDTSHGHIYPRTDSEFFSRKILTKPSGS